MSEQEATPSTATKKPRASRSSTTGPTITDPNDPNYPHKIRFGAVRNKIASLNREMIDRIEEVEAQLADERLAHQHTESMLTHAINILLIESSAFYDSRYHYAAASRKYCPNCAPNWLSTVESLIRHSRKKGFDIKEFLGPYGLGCACNVRYPKPERKPRAKKKSV
jgi:hypothetical protein